MDERIPSVDSLASTGKPWLQHLLGPGSANAIIVIDSAGLIAHWLGGAERYFGYTTEEAVGMAFGSLFSVEDRDLGLDRQEMAVAVATGRSEDDRWHVRKDGSRFWASGVLEAVWEADGTLSSFCKVLRDRTDIRSQIDALRNQAASLETVGVRRGESLLSVAHEFRNALAPMQNALSALEHTSDEATTSKLLSILQRQLSGVTTLVGDLVEVADGAMTRPRLNAEKVVVNDALRDAANSMSLAVRSSGHTLTVTVPDAPFVIEADPERLQQMLLNLLGNAVKFTPAGGRIHLTATVEDGDAVIRVSDDGIGIPGDVLPYIFELFTRGGASGFPAGQGIGLAVVNELATLHGGGVGARSDGEGKGSVFTIRLPLPSADPTERRRYGASAA